MLKYFLIVLSFSSLLINADTPIAIKATKEIIVPDKNIDSLEKEIAQLKKDNASLKEQVELLLAQVNSLESSQIEQCVREQELLNQQVKKCHDKTSNYLIK